MTTEKQTPELMFIREMDLRFSSGNSVPVDAARIKGYEWEAIRPLLMEAALASAQAQQEPLCPCEDRPASACDEQWGPQCDLGNNPAHVRVAPPVQQAEPVADLLSIARECGLRQFLHGVNATDARALLSAFVKTLDRQRAAPTAPAAEKREPLPIEVLKAWVTLRHTPWPFSPNNVRQTHALCAWVQSAHSITPADAKDL